MVGQVGGRRKEGKYLEGFLLYFQRKPPNVRRTKEAKVKLVQTVKCSLNELVEHEEQKGKFDGE